MSATETLTPPQGQPPQHQEAKPGRQNAMQPEPIIDNPNYKAAGKLQGKVAMITGGDSGIGAAVAIAYAKEGADVAIVYLNEHDDAKDVKKAVEGYGQRCLLIPGDIKDEAFCRQAVEKTVSEFGKLNILVNNAGEHFEQEKIEDISAEQLDLTYRTNVYPLFYITKAAMAHLHEGDTIINTASVTAYKGSPHLLDYSSTKGAIVTFTYSLAGNLASKGIRVNAVAPGPIWTPLIPATFSPEDVAEFGTDTPMGRAGQPYELAPAYVFLACEDSSYISGQMIHVNGGRVVNG